MGIVMQDHRQSLAVMGCPLRWALDVLVKLPIFCSLMAALRTPVASGRESGANFAALRVQDGGYASRDGPRVRLLKKGLDMSDPILIDVRSEGEYASGYVQGSVNLPLDRFTEGIAQVATDKSAPLVLYCVSGARSGAACAWLQKEGYTQVSNGGSTGAVAMALGRPIERG